MNGYWSLSFIVTLQVTAVSRAAYTSYHRLERNTISQGTRLRGYKTFFMLNSTEHESFSANKYEMPTMGWNHVDRTRVT